MGGRGEAGGDISPRKNSLGIRAEKKPREETGRIIREMHRSSHRRNRSFERSDVTRKKGGGRGKRRKNLNCEALREESRGKKKKESRFSIPRLSGAIEA